MTYEELEAMLTEGLDDASKTAARALLNRDSIKAKAAGLKAQAEFDAIQSQARQFQLELEGTDKVPGTKAYAKWYADNYEGLNKAAAAFDAKFGAGAYNKLMAGQDPGWDKTPTPQVPSTMTKEEIAKIAREQFETFAPNIANVVKGAGTLVQKHMYAKRTNPIDFEALDKLMADKKLSLEQAYDEWDKPERDKDLKAAEDARVDQRVKEELQRRGTQTTFPGGADYTPGVLANRTKAETDKFDRTAMMRDLSTTFATGEYKQ